MAGGHRQIHGIDFFDTFAPVVNWATIRFLLVLTAQLGLASKQVDWTAAFVHADIDRPPGYDEMTPDEREKVGVYVQMPRGFSKPGHVLRLNKNLYGLKQAPRNWALFLRKNLEQVGFKPCFEVDSCLFMSKHVLCVTYVDDCVMVSTDMKYIDEVVAKLKDPKGCAMDLEEENDVAGFLGILIQRGKNTIKLTQQGLKQRIIDALHIEDLPAVSTPADRVLGKDEDGDPAHGDFNYASVIGMMWYLTSHTHPELSFAVSQAARFAFAPKRCHELALIRIGQYLKSCPNDGIIMTPIKTADFHMEVYVDSDFLGVYGKEKRDDPDNVRSRAGYVILINGCAIVWKSVLTEAICMSTMMAEYYALSAAMREALPLRNLVFHIAKSCGLSHVCSTTFRTTVWEDNMGALTLAQMDPGQYTSRSKFYDVKVHWFRSHLSPEVVVKKIDTKEQKADILTKDLPRDQFEYLRFLLCGW